MERIGILGLAVATLSACAPAEIAPERLRISAGDGQLEARTRAVTWSSAAQLRWLEGSGVAADGFAYPGEAGWAYVYDAPDRQDQLVVTVTSRAISEETRTPQSPTGVVIGGRVLEPGWVDSTRAMQAVLDAGGEAFIAGRTPSVSMRLLPMEPPQWRVRITVNGEVREWRVHARTGAVLS